MTTLCLKAKNSVETENWSGIFTNFNTEAKSSLFIRQLTNTCISTILHLRKVFPDDYFEEKNIEGMTIKLLKLTAEEYYTSKIKNWLEGAFEAVEKKYLKRLMLDIQDAESNLTLEIYTMTFNYKKEVVDPSFSTSTLQNDSSCTIPNTQLSTIKLLQMCHAVTQNYSNLPPKIKLSMRLSYYENTPENYQPSGYVTWEPTDPVFPKQARSVEIGTTSTQYHLFKLLNKSCLSDEFFKNMENLTESGRTILPLKESTHECQKLESATKEGRGKAKRELYFGNTSRTANLYHLPKNNAESGFGVTQKYQPEEHKPLNSSNSYITCEKSTKKTTAATKVYKKADIQKQQVRCACLSSEKSETMFSCLACQFLVHTECYGILEFDSSKKVRFYCHLCHQPENNVKCHDKVIVGLKNTSDQQKLSVLRRVLRYCTKSNIYTITLKNMQKIAGASCPNNVVNAVLNKMIEIGIAIKQIRRKSYLLDKQVLANELVHYFYKVQNSNLSQVAVSSYSLRNSDNLKRKNNRNDVFNDKRNKQFPPLLQEKLTCNSQNSQKSCDMFC